MDHYDAPFRVTAATAGHPIYEDDGALYSVGSVAAYQERNHTAPHVSLEVNEVNAGAVEEKRYAALYLRPDEAISLAQGLIQAANVLLGTEAES